MNIGFNINTTQTTEEIKELLRKRMLDFAKKEIDNMLITPTQIANMSSRELKELNNQTGMLHALISDKLNNFALEYAASGKIEAYIERNVDHAMEVAVNKALEHKANALAFKAIKDRKFPIPLGIPDIPLMG